MEALTISLAGMLKLVWYTFNATLSFIWMKHRIVMDSFLAGKWKGSFEHKKPDGNTIDGILTKCILVVSRHKDKSNSAYIYYELHDIKNEKILAKGFDELVQYEPYWNFIIKREWTPKFCRLIHKTDSNANTDNCIYNFECKAINIFFKPRILARIAVDENRYLYGYLEKS